MGSTSAVFLLSLGELILDTSSQLDFHLYLQSLCFARYVLHAYSLVLKGCLRPNIRDDIKQRPVHRACSSAWPSEIFLYRQCTSDTCATHCHAALYTKHIGMFGQQKWI